MLKVEPHGDMSVLTFVNNAAGAPTATRSAQHAVHAQVTSTQGQPRDLRAGQVDGEPVDDDLLARATTTSTATCQQDKPAEPRARVSFGRTHVHSVWSARSIAAARHTTCSDEDRAARPPSAEFLAQQALGLTAVLKPHGGQTDTRTRTICDGKTGTASMRRATPSSTSSGRPRTRISRFPVASRLQTACPAPNKGKRRHSTSCSRACSVTGGYYRRQSRRTSSTREPRVASGAGLHAVLGHDPRHTRPPRRCGQVVTHTEATTTGVNDNITNWSTENTRVATTASS